MAKKKRTRWVDVYSCEMSAQAHLLASVLNANGLEAKVQRRKTNDAEVTIPYVRVEQSQQDIARDLLAEYQLESLNI